MTNASWGTKRACPRCSANFYDLNKLPAHCPKCEHEFEPTTQAKPKRKPAKRAAEKENTITPTILAAKKLETSRKKDKKPIEDVDGAGDDIVELEDDADSLKDLSELSERDPEVASDDDADDESIIEDLDAGEKVLVENIEDEEAAALVDELEEEDEAAKKKKNKSSKSK